MKRRKAILTISQNNYSFERYQDLLCTEAEVDEIYKKFQYFLEDHEFKAQSVSTERILCHFGRQVLIGLAFTSSSSMNQQILYDICNSKSNINISDYFDDEDTISIIVKRFVCSGSFRSYSESIDYLLNSDNWTSQKYLTTIFCLFYFFDKWEIQDWNQIVFPTENVSDDKFDLLCPVSYISLLKNNK